MRNLQHLGGSLIRLLELQQLRGLFVQIDTGHSCAIGLNVVGNRLGNAGGKTGTLDTNPYLRAYLPALKAAVGLPDADDATVFAEIRARKDKF